MPPNYAKDIVHYQLSFQILKKRQTQLNVVNKTQLQLSTKQIYAIKNFQQYDLTNNLYVNVSRFSRISYDIIHFYKINRVIDDQNL